MMTAKYKFLDTLARRMSTPKDDGMHFDWALQVLSASPSEFVEHQIQLAEVILNEERGWAADLINDVIDFSIRQAQDLDDVNSIRAIVEFLEGLRMIENGYVNCAGSTAIADFRGDPAVQECGQKSNLNPQNFPRDEWYFDEGGQAYCPFHWPAYLQTLERRNAKDARRSDETFNEFYRNHIKRAG